ncbi:MAG: hypothetical protein A2176_00800 [Spirochaetes bacterium RBG_13_51_14]|nr:MAG: hypothetical protein A2176_00800 [Spirochaetes bacterium RBG_13_51_14]
MITVGVIVPVHLNVFEKTGISLLNQGPGPMVDLLGMLTCKAVSAALRLGIFEAMEDDGRGIDEIAAAAGADAYGVSLLVGALENLGYLKQRRGKYVVTAMTRKWILRSSPRSIADLFLSFDDMASRWDQLHESIRAGRPPVLGWEWLDQHPERWDTYHAGLKCTASLVSGELMRKISLPSSARTILDLGGGHGQYCIEFCRRYSRLTGTVYDWQPAEAVARKNIAASGLSGRVAFRAGDFVKEDIGSGYDVVLMFNIIRIFTARELAPLFRKTFDALNRGGVIIVMDHMGHSSRSRFMRANAFLILLEIYNSTIGSTHRAAVVISLLRQAGFSRNRDYSLHRSPGLGLVVGRKK